MNLDFTPSKIMALKLRGGHQVMFYNQETSKLSIFTEDLTKHQASTELQVDGEQIIDFHQQPLSLVFHTKSRIGFYKYGSMEVIRKSNQCRTSNYQIDQVTYDMANPGVFLTLDRKKNAVLVFDAKGSNKNFECNLKGILRFGPVLQEIRDGLSFDKMYI